MVLPSVPSGGAVETKPDLYDPEEGDADLSVTNSYYQHNTKATPESDAYPGDKYGADGAAAGEDGGIETKIPNFGTKAWLAGLLASFAAIPATVKLALAASALAGVVAWGLLTGGNSIPIGRNVNVAFIGNSYMYVNDLPRMMETMSEGHIFQDSCLHGQGSILNLLRTGNGMFYKWATDAAVIDDEVDEDGESLYDFGACSVPQLLTGEDVMISSGNQLGSFYNDGNNPCFDSKSYYKYRSSFEYSESWDFVVMTDQSKRMCFEDARKEALMAFNYTYAPILKKTKTKPIIIQPHAFWSDNANMTGLEDIPTFTSKIMEGAKEYKSFLDGALGFSQRTKIAPVGDAFLTVWEEDIDMWANLFLSDGVHPSGYGTLLYGMVIYASIYGNMPKSDVVVTDDVPQLFVNARKLQAYQESQYPSMEEAEYLYGVARKVVLSSYKPKYSSTSTSSSSSTSSTSTSTQSSGTDYYAYDGDDNAD
jgi:hypothetical protein